MLAETGHSQIRETGHHLGAIPRAFQGDSGPATDPASVLRNRNAAQDVSQSRTCRCGCSNKRLHGVVFVRSTISGQGGNRKRGLILLFPLCALSSALFKDRPTPKRHVYFSGAEPSLAARYLHPLARTSRGSRNFDRKLRRPLLRLANMQPLVGRGDFCKLKMKEKVVHKKAVSAQTVAGAKPLARRSGCFGTVFGARFARTIVQPFLLAHSNAPRSRTCSQYR